MVLSISSELWGRLRGELAEAFPREGCGFLLGEETKDGAIVRRLHPAINRAPAGSDHEYIISPDDYREMERQAKAAGLRVLGVYHSHPNARPTPSAYDQKLAWENLSYLIVTTTENGAGEFELWRLPDWGKPLEKAPLAIIN
ncbi:MAG: M67 family metallopeptidase [bacterium]